MGRDDSSSKGTNKQSLPQTPKNLKIKFNKVKEEIANELNELHQLVEKRKNKRKLNETKECSPWVFYNKSKM